MSDGERSKRAEELFYRFLEIAEDQRTAFLDESCEGDDALRREIESLVAHHQDADSFLERPAVQGLQSTIPVSESPVLPSEIGPYQIRERLGEGGMGEVYLAQQSEPIKRQVALKLIKAGMDTREVIARFESERQALAMMNHPNVAKIYDAGSTESGRPFFAMEYVAGESITSYCDRHKLGLKQRLQLFIPTCQAIHHAHQKGIIHRDIKPTNVLVTIEDGLPVPKVIDFGVAKATQQTLTEKTLYTAQGALVGTPAYMSPEQAEMTGLNIDTTTDVYSLGVLLYELLVGARPFDDAELRKAGIAEIHRIIREVEPSKPSTRIRSMGDTATDITARRQSEPRVWQKLLDGELDWITMRAMEKDRSRRYQSAYALAEDVERYLRNDAVAAGPPSQLYRFQKMVARNRLGAAFAATVLLLILGFGVSMAILRQNAETARREAQTRAEELEQVTAFQASMLSGLNAEEMGHALYSDLREGVAESMKKGGFPAEEIDAALSRFEKSLGQVNSTDVALELIDEQILQRSVRALEDEFADQPLVQAALQETVAKIYRDIGRFEPGLPLQEAALETFRRQLGDEHPQTLHAVNTLGDLHYSMGMHEAAEVRYREALRGSRRALGEDHAETLRSLVNMSEVMHAIGALDSAEVYCRAALEGNRRVLGNKHAETLVALNNLASLFISRKDYEAALPLYVEAAAGQRIALGEDHPETLNTINNLGFTYQKLGQPEKALESFREALEGRRRVLGDAHPNTLISLSTMASLLKSMGRLEESVGYYEQTLAGRRVALGDDHPRTLTTMSNLAVLLTDMGRREEAVEYHAESIDRMRRVFGEEHQSTLSMSNRMGELLTSMGRYDEALEYLRRSHAACRRLVGDEHSVTLRVVRLIAEALRLQGKPSESLSMLLPNESAARKVFGEKAPDRLGLFLTQLGWAQIDRREFAAAESNLNEAHRLLNANVEEGDPPKRHEAQTALVELYEAWHRVEPSAGHDATAKKLRNTLAQTERP